MTCAKPSDSLVKTRKQRCLFQPEDDEKLKAIVRELGTTNWPAVAREMGTRDARQCRDRWQNYLAPSIVNAPWTDAEDELLRREYQAHGPCWRVIARAFPSRTDVNIKNRWRQMERHSRRKRPDEPAPPPPPPPPPPAPAPTTSLPIDISQQELEDILKPLAGLEAMFDCDLSSDKEKSDSNCKSTPQYEKF